MAWDFEYTNEFEEWFEALNALSEDLVTAAVLRLQVLGPALGRPFVDNIKMSHHHNMKELRPVGGHLRILFAFDPRRTAILLLGGDKSGQWSSWYDRMVPYADQLYDLYLKELRDEGLIP